VGGRRWPSTGPPAGRPGAGGVGHHAHPGGRGRRRRGPPWGYARPPGPGTTGPPRPRCPTAASRPRRARRAAAARLPARAGRRAATRACRGAAGRPPGRGGGRLMPAWLELVLRVAGVLAAFLVLPLVVGQAEHKVM